jgi:hypothetical protein
MFFELNKSSKFPPGLRHVPASTNKLPWIANLFFRIMYVGTLNSKLLFLFYQLYFLLS